MLPDDNKLPQSTPADETRCFGCGQENPVGLKLRFHSIGDIVEAEFIPTELYQGYPGYLHGGIVFTLLDEAMGWAMHSLGVVAVTARAEVRFKQLALLGESLLIKATIIKKTRKLLKTRAWITTSDGSVVAEGEALMYIAGKGNVVGV